MKHPINEKIKINNISNINITNEDITNVLSNNNNNNKEIQKEDNEIEELFVDNDKDDNIDEDGTKQSKGILKDDNIMKNEINNFIGNYPIKDIQSFNVYKTNNLFKNKRNMLSQNLPFSKKFISNQINQLFKQIDDYKINNKEINKNEELSIIEGFGVIFRNMINTNNSNWNNEIKYQDKLYSYNFKDLNKNKDFLNNNNNEKYKEILLEKGIIIPLITNISNNEKDFLNIEKAILLEFEFNNITYIIIKDYEDKKIKDNFIKRDVNNKKKIIIEDNKKIDPNIKKIRGGNIEYLGDTVSISWKKSSNKPSKYRDISSFFNKKNNNKQKKMKRFYFILIPNYKKIIECNLMIIDNKLEINYSFNGDNIKINNITNVKVYFTN